MKPNYYGATMTSELVDNSLSGEERKHALSLYHKTVILFFLSCVGGVVVGVEFEMGLEKIQTELEVWEKLHIGAFIIATISFVLLIIITSVHKRERESYVIDTIGCFPIVLWFGIVGFGISTAFVCLFIDTSKVFNSCNGTVLLQDNKKPCLEHLMPFVVLFIITLGCFITGIVMGCTLHNPMNVQVRRSHGYHNDFVYHVQKPEKGSDKTETKTDVATVQQQDNPNRLAVPKLTVNHVQIVT